MTLRKKAFENIVGKGENAGHQHFLLFPQCFFFFFYPFQKRKFFFSIKFNFSSANSFNLDQSKKLSFGYGAISFSNVNGRSNAHQLIEKCEYLDYGLFLSNHILESPHFRLACLQ